MLAYNDKISREMIERDGSDANVIAAADSAVGDEVVGQLARVCSALTLGTSRRRALDKLIYDRYGLLRNAASPAQGSVVFTTTNPTAGSFAIPKNTKLTTPDGIVFYTIVAATFPSGSVGPVTVQVQSTAAGVSQAPPSVPLPVSSILSQALPMTLRSTTPWLPQERSTRNRTKRISTERGCFSQPCGAVPRPRSKSRRSDIRE